MNQRQHPDVSACSAWRHSDDHSLAAPPPSRPLLALPLLAPLLMESARCMCNSTAGRQRRIKKPASFAN
jgi:hypothetical protein